MPLVVTRSPSSYGDTVRRLIDAIERRELTVFARVDHAAGARAAGLELEDEEVVLFGSPRAGTPLMQADRTVGIELPLRLLVWREGDDVHVGYRDPHDLAERYDVGERSAVLDQMAGLLGQLVSEATA